ncbi:hypothetical protein [Burkholderia mayonis]|uniref:Uncharacterized protein n=1 Tax=Burkholderia mayonis TaxID=1385591 RepID=A0A1B4FRT8_9BURK|nr:hypothetical protein [Burkholderia mayonis]AOJ06368.1 hypothetical protein WS71_02765 [Burkholderia mayonis]
MDETNIESVDTPEKSRTVEIQATLATIINLADFQNAVPVVRELAVANDTKNDIKQLRLTVSSEPSFFKSKTWHIDHIGVGTRQKAGLRVGFRRFGGSYPLT